MADLVAQAIFHTFVAALTVEALVRLWRLGEARLRFAFRVLPLALPLVLLPVFALAAPERATLEFRDAWAVFAGRRWADVRILGVGLYGLWIALFASLGTALFLRDLVPLVGDARRRRGRAAALGAPLDERVGAAVVELASRLGTVAPRVVVEDRPAAVLLCAGVARPRLVVSTGALALLDEQELYAAVAHELAHFARRDPLVSWVVMAARALMFFNPAFQVAARLLARETEWRADDDAVLARGDPLALASGLLKLYRASMAPARRPRLAWLPSVDGPLTRATAQAVARRCRRLLDGTEGPMPLPRVRLGLTALSLAGLLFFVV